MRRAPRRRRGSAPGLAIAHLAVRPVVVGAGAGRGAHLVQLRQEPFGVPVAVVALVLGRPGAVGVARRLACSTALCNTLKLAGLSMLIATPIGVAMAIGLQRWRGKLSNGVERVDAGPDRDPRDRLRRRPVPRLHAGLHGRAAWVHHPTARARHVHASRSSWSSSAAGWRRSGRSTKKRRATSGRNRLQAMRLVLLPLLGPAIFASLMVVFADVDRRLRDLVVPVDRRRQPRPCRSRSTPAAGPRPRRRSTRWPRSCCVFTLGAVALAGIAIRSMRNRGPQAGGGGLTGLAS